MKLKITFWIILLVTLNSCKAQKLFDISKPYNGYIVNQDVDVSIEGKKSSFIPSNEEIVQAEKLLESALNDLNKSNLNQGGKDCPNIERNLQRYVRQYVGYINQTGDKIILINMLWDNDLDFNNLRSEYIIVFDGCSHYWRVKVNLTKNKVYDLQINGSA